MMSVAKKDEAVSPVIGTILLVAITVVLVAIVAAVVMGMVGGVSDSKTVGVTVQPYANSSTDGGYILTAVSGKDASTLKNVSAYMIVGKDSYEQNPVSQNVDPAIGKPNYVKMASGAAGMTGQLTITGTFSDGSKSVIYQGTVTIPTTTT